MVLDRNLKAMHLCLQLHRKIEITSLATHQIRPDTNDYLTLSSLGFFVWDLKEYGPPIKAQALKGTCLPETTPIERSRYNIYFSVHKLANLNFDRCSMEIWGVPKELLSPFSPLVTQKKHTPKIKRIACCLNLDKFKEYQLFSVPLETTRKNMLWVAPAQISGTNRDGTTFNFPFATHFANSLQNECAYMIAIKREFLTLSPTAPKPDVVSP